MVITVPNTAFHKMMTMAITLVIVKQERKCAEMAGRILIPIASKVRDNNKIQYIIQQYNKSVISFWHIS